MPSKRYVRRPICFLTPIEIDALLVVPDLGVWSGRRDRALLLLAVQTGLRAAEVIGLRCENIVLGAGAHVQCLGKGRKTRCTPLRKEIVAVLVVGYENGRGSLPILSFPPHGASRSVTTDWNTCSTSI
jgi:integrase